MNEFWTGYLWGLATPMVLGAITFAAWVFWQVRKVDPEPEEGGRV